MSFELLHLTASKYAVGDEFWGFGDLNEGAIALAIDTAAFADIDTLTNWDDEGPALSGCLATVPFYLLDACWVTPGVLFQMSSVYVDATRILLDGKEADLVRLLQGYPDNAELHLILVCDCKKTAIQGENGQPAMDYTWTLCGVLDLSQVPKADDPAQARYRLDLPLQPAVAPYHRLAEDSLPTAKLAARVPWSADLDIGTTHFMQEYLDFIKSDTPKTEQK